MKLRYIVIAIALMMVMPTAARADETDILVDDVDKEEELVAVEHGFDGSVVVGSLYGFAGDAFTDVADSFGAVGLAHFVAEAFQYPAGNVFHTNQDGGCEAGVGEFLGHVVCPETVAQVVVLDGGVLLQFAVAAVVVGGDESFVGNDFTGAEVPEGTAVVAKADDGVLDAVLVDGIDVFGREFETGFLHVGIVFANEREEPHALVGAAGGGGQNQQGQSQSEDDFLHAVNVLCY